MYFLKIGSKEFQIGHEALSSLASSIPDHPDNLEYMTRSENILHYRNLTGKRSKQYYEEN